MSVETRELRMQIPATGMSRTQQALSIDDAKLEAAIDLATLRCQTATTPNRRRAAFEELRGLVAQRSPQQVAHLEQSRGLTR